MGGPRIGEGWTIFLQVTRSGARFTSVKTMRGWSLATLTTWKNLTAPRANWQTGHVTSSRFTLVLRWICAETKRVSSKKKQPKTVMNGANFRLLRNMDNSLLNLFYRLKNVSRRVSAIYLRSVSSVSLPASKIRRAVKKWVVYHGWSNSLMITLPGFLAAWTNRLSPI